MYAGIPAVAHFQKIHNFRSICTSSLFMTYSKLESIKLYFMEHLSSIDIAYR